MALGRRQRSSERGLEYTKERSNPNVTGTRAKSKLLVVGRWTELDATTKDQEIANRGREGHRKRTKTYSAYLLLCGLCGPLGGSKSPVALSRLAPRDASWTARRHGAALTAARRPNGSAADAPRSRSRSPSEFRWDDEGGRKRGVGSEDHGRVQFIYGRHPFAERMDEALEMRQDSRDAPGPTQSRLVSRLISGWAPAVWGNNTRILLQQVRAGAVMTNQTNGSRGKVVLSTRFFIDWSMNGRVEFSSECKRVFLFGR